MHDTTLDALCRQRPSSSQELLRVPGIGERKAEKYGAQILDALRRSGAGQRAAPRAGLEPTAETMQFLREGKTLLEIAQIRKRQYSTIVNMVADLVERGFVAYQAGWVEASRRTQIETAADKIGLGPLRPIKDSLPLDFTYEEIRLVVSHLRWRTANGSASAATP
jgi:ATP-dependent DNA helicase RecQ